MYDKILLYLDRVFIWPYRLIPDPLWAYFFGTFCLVALCVIIGELSVGLAVYVNRNHVKKLTEELIHWNNLTVEAVERGDSEAYHRFNKEANDVYGKLFFLSIAHSAACLWPIPFVLAWMEMRFGEVRFPLPFHLDLPIVGDSVNYVFTFVILYLPAWWLFKQVKKYLPLFKKIDALIEESGRAARHMKSLAEIIEKRVQETQANKKAQSKKA